MDDKRIIALFFARSEDAIAEVSAKYGRYCRSVALNILGDEGESENALNDTWMKLWETIPPNDPQSLKSYAGMVCRDISLNTYERLHAKKRSGELGVVLDEVADFIPGDSADIADTLALQEAINSFLRSLPEKTRRVFVQRYWYAATVAQIAADNGMKTSAVTTLLMRTRNKLKDHLEKEGIDI